MEKAKRLLSILMCLCLLCTSMHGDLFAARAEANKVLQSSAEEMVEAYEEEMILGGENPETAEMQDSVGENVKAQEAEAEFVFGYAKLTQDAALYSEATGGLLLAELLGGSIVLVTEQSETADPARMRVTFVHMDAVASGWVDASVILPMTVEEIGDYQSSITEAICYQDDVNYPLPVPELFLASEGESEKEEIVDSAETAVPDQTAAAEATIAPTVSEEISEGEEAIAPSHSPEAPDNVDGENTPESDGVDVPESTEEPVQDICDNLNGNDLQNPESVEENNEYIPESVQNSVGMNGEPLVEPETEYSDFEVMMQTALYVLDEPVESADPDELENAVYMTIEPDKAVLNIGESVVVHPVFSDGTERSVSYTVDVSDVVAIDPFSREITALAVGTAVVQVKCDEIDGLTSRFEVIVEEQTQSSEDVDVVPASEISIIVEYTDLVVGEILPIECSVPEGAEGEVVFSLSNENVLSLNENGELIALSEGESIVTAELTYDGQVAAVSECRICVHNVPEEFVENAPIKLGIAQTAVVIANTDESLLNRIAYASSDEAIASVDEEGTVTAHAAGACVISVALGNKTAEIPVEICDLPFEFVLNISKDALHVGETAQLMAEFSEDWRGDVVFASLNPEVAAVDKAGSVAAVGAGTAELTATVGNITQSLIIEVIDVTAELECLLEQPVLEVGRCTQAVVSLTRSINEITYHSSDPAVAVVDDCGVVTAVSEGSCEIIAETDSGIQGRAVLQVVKSAVSLNEQQCELAVGQKVALQHTVNDAARASGDAVYSSLDSSVATVDPLTGVVTAVSEGETAVVLTMGDSGAAAQCSITVRKAPTSIKITDAAKTIGVKQVTDAIEYVLYAGNEPTVGTVSFKSSNTKIVKVNSSGQMLGVKAGTATITVTSYNKEASASFKVTVRKAPSKLTINPASASLAVGQSGKISHTLSKNTAAGITYSSSDKNVAVVNAAGKVTAVGVGTAKIKVSTHNGLVKYCSITVTKAPENVTLKLSASKLGVSMKAAAKASVDASSSVSFAFKFWTDAPEIISVDAKTGAIEALSEGSAKVFVETYNGVTSHEGKDGRVETSATVKVVPAPDNVEIDGTEFNIIVGNTITLPVVMTMNDGSTDCMTTYTLATSKKKIAQVNDAGQVKGVKAGTAKIRLTASSGQRVDVTVNVRAKARKVVLNQSKLTLGVGMKSTLLARVYYSSKKYYQHSSEDALGTGRFASSDSSVVKIDAATGVMTAVGKGTATVAYKTINGKSAKCSVTVLGEPTKIGLNTDSVKLGVGMSKTLKVVYQKNEMGPVTFKSSDSGVAKVNKESGKVTAVGMGTATITADAGGGVTATCKVKVVPAPDNVEIDGTEFNIIVGNTITLPVVMTMDDGSTDCMTTYTLATSKKKIAQVNDAGQVKGVKAGTAKIRLTAASGQKVDVTVNVRAKARKVVLNQSKLTLGVGMKSTLLARVYYSSKKYYQHSSEDALGTGRFASSDSSVVKINAATGVMTAVGKGTATVAYKTINGKSAKCSVTVFDAPTELKLNSTKLTLGVDMSTALKVSFNSYEYGSLTYKSSDRDVAKVNGSGVVTAVGPGAATITATAQNGVSASCKVSVVPAPDKITLNMTGSNLAIKGKVKLQPICTFEGSENCKAKLTYKSSNKRIATVTDDGMIQGLRTGSAIIRVMAQNGVYADCKVVVRKKPKKVQFEKTSLTLGVGQSASVAAKITYSGGSCLFSVNDSSYARLSIDDPTIAALDAKTGKVIGVGVGYTDLRIKTYNGKTAKCRIVVGPGAEWISFEESSLTLSKGENRQLDCSKSVGSKTTITYTSSKPKVVSVSASEGGCMLKALSQGTAVITAESSNGKTSVCEVTVMAGPDKIVFEESSIAVGVGETSGLPAVIATADGEECNQNVTYTISGEAAVLNKDGSITGVKSGVATVTASAFDGLTAACKITVKKAPSSITLTSDKSILAVGHTARLAVRLDTVGSYVLSVDDESVLSLSDDGKITALKSGKAVVTATAYNGCSASCTITVKKAPEWVRFDSDVLSLGEGMEHKLTASIAEDAHAELVYLTSNSKVAVVDEDGRVTALAPGSANVRVYVSGNNKVFDTCRVTVLDKPDSVVLSGEKLTLRKGVTASLNAVFSCESGEECFSEAVYKSSKSSVASVDETGTVTAVGVGEAIVTAALSYDSSVSASCKVVVIENSVGFDVSALKLSVGERYALRVDLPDGKDKFSVRSSNPVVAEIDPETYEISALSEGTATITAVNGSDSASCTVEVTQKPSSIKLSASTKKLTIGSGFMLKTTLQPEGSAAQLSYSSSDKAVATVAQNGYVKAVGYGSAKITVSNQDGSLKAVCNVTSLFEPDLIRFGEIEDIVIAVGDAYPLETPQMYSAGGDCYSSYTLSVSNSKRARASLSQGRYVIKGISEGSVVLRLKTANGKTATHNLIVVEKPDSIGFKNESLRMAVGESNTPMVLGSNGAAMAAALTSSNSKCVRVAENGSLEALTEGTAIITATAVNFPDLTAEMSVKVVKAPESMRLSASSLTLGVGEIRGLTVSYDGGAANAVFASSDESVVQAGKGGLLRAVGVGKATVSAVTFNGLSASCTVNVKEAPTALKVSPASITASVKDSVKLSVNFGSKAEYSNMTFSSADKSVANVGADGTVTFSSVGETVICVKTFNGFTAEIPVEVCKAPATVSMTPASAVMLKSDKAKLDISFDKGAAYYTLKSSDTSVVRVSADGTVRAIEAGKAVVTFNVPSLGVSKKCSLTVVESLAGISLKADKTTLELHETTQLTCSLKPSDAIGTGGVTYTTSDKSVATVSKSGVVTGVSYGTAVITAKTKDGLTAKCKINVLGGKRRMLIAYYFGETGDHGYLPFAYNNGSSMKHAFSAAKVEGQTYDIKGPLSNAPKSTLLGTIDSHFADATDDDVSVIYICAHGSANGVTGEYAFKLDSNHYVTASEVMNRLEKIKGRVVLIMDSCYSGGMIDCNKSRLDAQDGRISILCSSHRSTNSCYWNVSQKLTSVDFYTHALLQGVGFNEAQGIGGSRGWFASDAGPADDAGNNDDLTTVSELFSYAKSVTVSNLAKYKGYKQFHGNPAQVPQSYIGSKNKDLVLFSR